VAACRSWPVSMVAACSASSASAVPRCSSRTGAGNSRINCRITPVCAGEITPSVSADAVAGSTGGSGSPSSDTRGPSASAACTRSLAWLRVNSNTAASNDAVSRYFNSPATFRAATSATTRCCAAASRRDSTSNPRNTSSSSSCDNRSRPETSSESTAARSGSSVCPPAASTVAVIQETLRPPSDKTGRIGDTFTPSNRPKPNRYLSGASGPGPKERLTKGADTG
jgi:hypothetical protein